MCLPIVAEILGLLGVVEHHSLSVAISVKRQTLLHACALCHQLPYIMHIDFMWGPEQFPDGLPDATATWSDDIVDNYVFLVENHFKRMRSTVRFYRQYHLIVTCVLVCCVTLYQML